MLNRTALIHLMGCSLIASRSLWVNDFAESDEGSGRVVNGEEVNEGEFKYVVGLTRKLDHSHKCGGTVLTKNWVLTAAHCCVLGAPHCFSVHAGSIYRNRGGSYHIVTKFIIHENYDESDKYKNDICLDFPVLPGEKLVAPGWGYTTKNKMGRVSPNRMRKLHMTSLGEECWEEVKWFPGYLCARGAKTQQGICQGDSGGPLMNHEVQVGITSFLLGMCADNYPDYFVRVSHYINWIKAKLGHEADKIKLYT